MTQREFISRLAKIKTAISISGKTYAIIHVGFDKIEFVREHKIKSEYISLTELYNLFSNENIINTAIARSYISGRVQSPAVAILNQLKNISSLDNLITGNASNKKHLSKNKPEHINKIKDETKFFNALSKIIGFEYILSKSIGKPINSTHIFLSNNYKDYSFNQEINESYYKILNDLKSNHSFTSDSLSHHVDGLIINHQILKNRIIEFDEEQHFTPARKDTLKHLSAILPDQYFTTFNDICNDITYQNMYVLKKHRINTKLETIPTSFKEFTEWLKKSNEKSSGYICDKNGFEFLGGRIAQRAYYDCLRDTAHLSEKNIEFESPLRFAKKIFEDRENTDFGLIPEERLMEIILEILRNNYKINVPGN